MTIASLEADNRAIHIGTECPDCCCEKVSVGRYGSPGAVLSKEQLHSVVINPPDVEMRADELWYTFITHAEDKGMSVLRQGASDDEFRRTISLRLKDANRRFVGIASFACGDVRELRAPANADRRLIGDRLYCVLDTDTEGRPNHADIFATMPRPDSDVSLKAAFRRQRYLLMNVLRQDFDVAEDFRNGVLVQNGTH